MGHNLLIDFNHVCNFILQLHLFSVVFLVSFRSRLGRVVHRLQHLKRAHRLQKGTPELEAAFVLFSVHMQGVPVADPELPCAAEPGADAGEAGSRRRRRRPQQQGHEQREPCEG